MMKKMIMSDEKKMTLELPVAYWDLIIDHLDRVCAEKLCNIEQNAEDLLAEEPEDVTSLVGPLLLRAMIVDKLIEEGHLENRKKFSSGFEWLSEFFREETLLN